LVLNSVTSTPQWIRQPEAAWGIVRIRNHKMRQIGCCCSSSSLILLLLLLLLFPLLLLAVRCIVRFRNHKMRQLGFNPLGRILIIETKAEQIRTNAFFVLQLENVRQNLVCGRVAPVVGKQFTTVLFPPSILEWKVQESMKTWRIAFFVFSSCNSSMWVF
jgi:hypothetical protein